jgi:hypothetical protein
LALVGTCYANPAVLDGKCWLYIGRIDGAVAGHFGAEGSTEEIETRVLPAAQAIAMLDNNEIQNVYTALILHWLARHHTTLRRKWLEK